MAKRERPRVCYSGIGGQAVLEGVMMRNGEKYAVAVRRPDGEIETEIQNHRGIGGGTVFAKIPLIRGVLNFLDSLVLGMRALNYSASFYDEESSKEHNESGTTGREKLVSVLVTAVSVALSVGLFVLLPTFLASLFDGKVRNASLTAMIEGALRIAIFLLYLVAISLMKDIRRLYRYHGAEHKCINCIESGRPLTPENAKASSRFHRRCGTSFLFFVVFLSVILFFFIRTDNLAARMGLRLLLVPVIAGISYEVLRLAGRYNNLLIRIISAPGIWVQHLTVKEPDEEMLAVAIASVEAVFDWRAYQEKLFAAPEPVAEYEDDDWDVQSDDLAMELGGEIDDDDPSVV